MMANRTVDILGGRHGVSPRWLGKWTGLAMRLAVRLAVAMAVAMAAVAGALLRSWMRPVPMTGMRLGRSMCSMCSMCSVCSVCSMSVVRVVRDVAPGSAQGVHAEFPHGMMMTRFRHGVQGQSHPIQG